MESRLGLIEQSFNLRYSLYVREVLDELPDSFTITDPCISGHPIVFASRGFLKMFGYSSDEVIGKNGRTFQGPKTNRRSVMAIREAIREERSIQITMLNYRKDGTPFWMLFHMCPVFGKEDGRVIHFVGVQVPIQRKQRRSSCGFGRNGVNLCEDGSGFRETVLGSCRREVCSDSVVESNRVLAMDFGLGSDDRGYARHEVLGQNCRFLSGVDTDFSTIFQIKESIQREQTCTVRILNYRKDKSSFWNLLHISPVRSASGKIAYYVGVQIDESCKNEDKHGLSPELRQHSVVGAVKVAVRSLSMGVGTSNS
ncbi:hypothetical protein ACSBR1_006610 [Camellia fascicularis]